jgi:hypothetical protein
MSDDGSKRPRRRALRYSLRAMLVMVTLLAIVLAYSVSRFAKDRRAVEAILARGGSVTYFDNSSGRVHAERTMLAWLREFVGLRRPYIVRLEGTNVTDEVIRDEVLPLRTLVWVSLFGVRVTDDGLDQLAPLDSLEGVTCLRDGRNEAVFNALDQPSQVEFQQVPLREAMEYLFDLHDMRFEIDQASVPVEYLGGRSTLTGTIKNKQLGVLLDSILAPHDLGWIVAGGRLRITSRAVQDERQARIEKVRAALPQLQALLID